MRVTKKQIEVLDRAYDARKEGVGLCRALLTRGQKKTATSLEKRGKLIYSQKWDWYQ